MILYFLKLDRKRAQDFYKTKPQKYLRKKTLNNYGISLKTI
jgi:hypothetical protein